MSEIRRKAAEEGVKLTLPVGFVCYSEFCGDGEIVMGDRSTGVPVGFLGLDIGPKSIGLSDATVAESETTVWHGPMGVFEMSAYDTGTKRTIDGTLEVTAAAAISVVGCHTAEWSGSRVPGGCSTSPTRQPPSGKPTPTWTIGTVTNPRASRLPHSYDTGPLVSTRWRSPGTERCPGRAHHTNTPLTDATLPLGCSAPPLPAQR